MNIDLNNLVNYFNNDDKIIVDINILKKDNTQNFNKIKKFENIFENKIERYGIISHSKQNNISFLLSLLFLLDNNFINISNGEQNKYIYFFKNKLKIEITEIDFLNKLKLKNNGWNKKNILKLIQKDKIDNNYINFISAYFNINIFIFELKSENIFAFYNDELYNKFKCNIFISKLDDIYEPIIFIDGSKHFKYNSNILNNVLNCNNVDILDTGFNKINKIKKFNIDNNIFLNLEFKNNFNLDNTLKYKVNKEDIEIEKEKDIYSEEYNNDIDCRRLELLKYKKPQLIEICKEKKIPYSNKNKNILVDLIINSN
tara:strand:- start:821 stop:1762 length:942 start_codon:yes stop_codon:yes gene_type:complete